MTFHTLRLHGRSTWVQYYWITCLVQVLVKNVVGVAQRHWAASASVLQGARSHTLDSNFGRKSKCLCGFAFFSWPLKRKDFLPKLEAKVCERIPLVLHNDFFADPATFQKNPLRVNSWWLVFGKLASILCRICVGFVSNSLFCVECVSDMCRYHAGA